MREREGGVRLQIPVTFQSCVSGLSVNTSRATFETSVLQVLSPPISILLGILKDQSKKHGRQLWTLEASLVCSRNCTLPRKCTF